MPAQWKHSLRHVLGEQSLGAVLRRTMPVLWKVLKGCFPNNGGTPIFKEHALAHTLLDGLRGVELGPSAGNPFGLQTLNLSHPENIGFYRDSDRQEFRVDPPRIDVWATGDILPFKDRSQDFVLSSHVVEHLPNVIMAFLDWNRIVRHDGYVFMIVPLKGALLADADRELSPLEHFIQDYRSAITLETHPTDDVPGGRSGHYHT